MGEIRFQIEGPPTPVFELSGKKQIQPGEVYSCPDGFSVSFEHNPGRTERRGLEDLGPIFFITIGWAIDLTLGELALKLFRALKGRVIYLRGKRVEVTSEEDVMEILREAQGPPS